VKNNAQEDAAVSANPDKPPRKQQQRSIRTKQKLLGAALEAFSENGFKGTSTRDIAERAGVHHPLITYHFNNKDELWRAAADRVFREFNSALLVAAQAQAGECPKARMAAMIRAYVHYAAGQPALHKIMVQESSRPSGRLDWLVNTHIRPLFDAAVEEIQVLQERGVAPAGDPKLLFNMIRVSSGALLALSLEFKGTSGIDMYQPGRLDELADMIISVFLPGEIDEE
jgi:AcrR family transcriptional regulator